MITGIVVEARREALIRLIVKGGEGRASEVEAVLDTGFTEYLTLPQEMLDVLLMPFLRTEETVLSDGSIIASAVHEGVVIWDGRERSIEIHASETSPLLGMSLLLEHLVTLSVVDGGSVAITPLA